MRFYADGYEKDEDGVWSLPHAEDSAELYARHLEEIWPRLSASVQELIKYMDVHSFHDWEIQKWGRDQENRTAFLEFFYGGRLEFEGVKEIEVAPRDDDSMWAWVVEEIDLAEDGSFVLRVLTGDGELRIVATEVRMAGFASYDQCTCPFCAQEGSG